jgi:hypothetical protein
VESSIPAWVLKRITPDEAGEAVARAVERRRPRVIAPRYWTVMSVLRGLLNPALDLAAVRATVIQDMLREADVEGRTTPRG